MICNLSILRRIYIDVLVDLRLLIDLLAPSDISVLIGLNSLQTGKHLAVAVERILLAVDGLDHVSIQSTIVLCIVPLSRAIVVSGLVQVLRRDLVEPALSSVTSRTIIVVLPLSNSCIRIGGICGCKSIIPLEGHYASLIKSVLVAVDGLGLVLIAILSVNLLTVGVEVEPVVLLFLVQSLVKSGLNLLIQNMQLSPASYLSTVIGGTAVVHTVSPVSLVGDSLTALIDPTPQHLSLVIEGVLLAVDGLEGYAISVRGGVSLTIVLEVVPYVLGVVLVHILIL